MKHESEFNGILKFVDPENGEPLKVLVFDQCKVDGELSMHFVDVPDDEDRVPWTLTITGFGDVHEYYASDFDERIKKDQEECTHA